MKSISLGVDIGGTNTRIALVSHDGVVRASRRYKTTFRNGKEMIIKTLISEMRGLMAESDNNERVAAVGIGAPGLIENGIIRHSPNLPDWNEVPLRKIIQDEVSLPVILENDANAAAYGELNAGAGKGFNSIVCITLGTGVGGGIILDRRIWHGAFGMAGEIGHTVVEPDGNLCNCGNRGCLETYASATGIVRAAKKAMERGEGRWDPDSLTAENLKNAAKEGDAAAQAIFAEAGRYLGIGISNLLHILNPDAVIIGGGVSLAWDYIYPSISEEIRSRCFREIAERSRIIKASLDDNAGVLGAAMLAFEGMSDREHAGSADMESTS